MKRTAFTIEIDYGSMMHKYQKKKKDETGNVPFGWLDIGTNQYTRM